MSYATGIASVVVLLFVAFNFHGLPLAHSIRLLPSAYRVFKPRLTSSPKKVTESNTKLSPHIFKPNHSSSRAILFDLDINIHKSNSTFFADADISRADLFSRFFSQALVDIAGGKSAANLILAGVQCRFLREVKPFQRYDILSRILAWDDENLWFVTWFVKPGVSKKLHSEEVNEKGLVRGVEEVLGDEVLRKGVFAVLMSKYVIRRGREKVKPGELMRVAGFDVEGEGVEGGRRQGMEYLRKCMG